MLALRPCFTTGGACGAQVMGGFFLICRGPTEDRVDELHRLLTAFTQIGFSAPEIITDDAYILAAFPKFEAKSPELKRYPNGDFVFTCGTCISDQGVGLSAADAFYRSADPLSAETDFVSGHYAVVMRKEGKTTIHLDQFGGYLVYFDADAGIVSSSFYAISSVLRSLTLQRQAAYEYVFNGVVSGNETIFSEVAITPIGARVDVDADGLNIRRTALEAPKKTSEEKYCESLQRGIQLLDRYFDPVAKTFKDRIRTALSGGYDSRLMLACLRRHGAQPRVYIYGQEQDPEVRLVQAIARGEGFPLAVIDKDAQLIVSPDEFAEVVRQNFFGVDGYNYGGIFQNGAERKESICRVAGKSIAFNGGGGEIFRNFFYLLDRPLRVRELLWAFYSGFDPACGTPLFEVDAYYRNLERKIFEVVGSDDPWLPRPTVEWLYHNFRCRAWDGKTDSNSNRFGYTAMPFLERRITEHASRLPLGWKNHGAYEAALIARIDPKLAAYPSNYGHSFEVSRPLWRRANDYGTYLRPPWLRRYTHRIKNSIRDASQLRGYLAPAYQDAALPGGPEIVRPLFRLNRVGDPDQYARVLSLEYVLRQFDSSLKVDF